MKEREAMSNLVQESKMASSNKAVQFYIFRHIESAVLCFVMLTWTLSTE
jgi:hypothetical protein